jgi:hypothetical protein
LAKGTRELKYRYLLIAAESWEIRFALEIARNIKDAQEVKILVADHYTPFYQKSFLENLNVPSGIQIISMENQYNSWQVRKYPDSTIDLMTFDLWEKKICKQRSLIQIMNSHQSLNGYENQATYLPISESWKKKIYFDYLKFATDLFLDNGPYRVIAMSRRSLLSNLIWEYSQYLNFEYLTITQSRIGNRLIVRDDFGYGMRLQHLEKIKMCRPSQEATNFIGELKSRNFLYKSWTNLKIEELNTQAKQPARAFYYELKKAFRRSIARLVFEYPTRRGKIRRLGESLVRLSIFEVNKSFRKLILRVFRKHFFDVTTPDKDFFAWFLHARPEDSTLVLGDGEDEVQTLIAFANELKPSQCVVVKENAQMYGARPVRFYLNLKRRGFLLLEPTHNNQEIFSRMVGLVGVSGTVLLESKLLGFSSYALGSPEFIYTLDNGDYSSLREFVDKAPTTKKSNEIAIKYVSWVLNQAPQDHLAFEGDWDSPKGKATLESISFQISQHWTDYKVSP